jgi:hypothetical protein
MGGVYWIGLALDSCESGDEPLGSIKCWKVLEFTSSGIEPTAFRFVA